MPNNYQELIDGMSDEACDMHRALQSLIEELEAIDFYNQRIEVCQDQELLKILCHNRDEEKEHAAMILEWISKKDACFEKELKSTLFSKVP